MNAFHFIGIASRLLGAITLCALLLGGCGQSGALYLPPDNTQSRDE